MVEQAEQLKICDMRPSILGLVNLDSITATTTTTTAILCFGSVMIAQESLSKVFVHHAAVPHTPR